MSKIYLQEKLMGNPGQVVSFITDPDNSSKKKAIVQNAPIDNSRSIILKVNAPDSSSRVIVTNGIYTFESNPTYVEFVPDNSDGLTTSSGDDFYVEENSERIFYLPVLGDWVVAASKGGLQTQSSISITALGSYEITLSYFKSYIDVVYTPGSICTCTNGAVILKALDTDGYHRFTVNKSGDWVVQAISEDGSGQAIETVSINSDDEIVEVVLDYVQVVLNNNSWKIIQSITSKGLASSYWSIGDCKQVILDGKILDGSSVLKEFNQQTVYAELIDFDHNTDIESNSKFSLSFQLGKSNVTSFVRGNNNGTRIGFYVSSGFVMQKTATNLGGWKDSFMRNHLMLEFRNVLPSDIVSCLLSVKKYTDNSVNASTHNTEAAVTYTYDDLFLLAPYEISGTFNNISNINPYEASLQSQYLYYQTSDNSKFIRYRDTATTTSNIWFLRSPWSSGSTYYSSITTSGTTSELLAARSANANAMISPVFVIGG